MRIADVERAGRALAERMAARTLARLPISPTALTLLGALLNVAVVVLLVFGHLPWAAIVMWVAAGFDAADGALARVTRRETDLGAFLDSTLDRYSEILVGVGLLAHLLRRGWWGDLVLLYLFLSGSLLFSYVRARAEAEGFSSHAGLFNRSMRVLVLGIGLLAGQLPITLWVLAVGVHLGALHRLLAVCLEARRRAFPDAAFPWPRWLKGRAFRRALREQGEGRSRTL